MNLAQAQRYAEQIVPWLTPFCERIQIAGSIRRLRPVCNDIDLVVIPKIRTETNPVDMFTTEQVKTNLLRDRLITYVRDPANRAAWLGREETANIVPVRKDPKPDAQNLLLTLKSGIQLDIFCATPETFATLLLCRTGSKEHNIWFAQRAIDHGGHWHPYKGLTLPVTNCHLPITNSGHIRATIEEDLYRALKTDFIPPENREIDYLRRLR